MRVYVVLSLFVCEHERRKESLNWTFPNHGLYEQMHFLLFQPIRGCVLGPPAVGKTHVVSQLCRHYKLHHIMAADVIKEAIERLVSVHAGTTHPWLLHYTCSRVVYSSVEHKHHSHPLSPPYCKLSKLGAGIKTRTTLLLFMLHQECI